MSIIKQLWGLLKETFNRWKEREPLNNSAIIAYFTIFSLPGLLMITISSVGYFYSKEEITSEVTAQIEFVMGGDTAKDIESIVTKAGEKRSTVISSILGIATLLFGATGVFYELQQMLNKIWNVPEKPRTKQRILTLIRHRIFSFGLILVVGFLLLVSLVLSAGLSAVSNWVAMHWSESFNIIFRTADIILSLGIVTILFAAIFKFLPDTKVKWKHVWAGALLTAFLFVIAKFALGFYLGQTNLISMYGAAGTIILIMLWVTFAGLILLFGAEFTHVYMGKLRDREMNRIGKI